MNQTYNIPDDATHITECYGRFTYYRKSSVAHLNQVSEEWQSLTKWHYWDNGKWADVGNDFSSRRLCEIEKT